MALDKMQLIHPEQVPEPADLDISSCEINATKPAEFTVCSLALLAKA